ncbi:MAG: hypothetical protein ACM3JJ_03220 [Hyphomicrobiales bacterium]
MKRMMSRAGVAVPLIATVVLVVGCGSKGRGEAEAKTSDAETASAPAPPRVRIDGEPRLDAVVSGVYVVNHGDYDGDLFRVGGIWYDYNDGYWYRAAAMTGPYVAIDVESVPVEIFDVPTEHWTHYPSRVPPGIAKRMGRR